MLETKGLNKIFCHIKKLKILNRGAGKKSVLRKFINVAKRFQLRLLLHHKKMPPTFLIRQRPVIKRKTQEWYNPELSLNQNQWNNHCVKKHTNCTFKKSIYELLK